MAIGLLILLAWEGLAMTSGSLLLPTVEATAGRLIELAGTGELWHALWVSNQAALLGFALAGAIGVPLGLAMGRWPGADWFFDPYLNVMLATPMSAAIPVVIMVAGLGLPARVLVVVLFALSTIVFHARAGYRLVGWELLEMSAAFGAGEWQLWRKVLLRGAAPGILLGVRLGAIRAVSAMVTIELLLVAVGMGRLILDAQGSLDAAGLFASVIVIVAESVLLAHLFQRMEQDASHAAMGMAAE